MHLASVLLSCMYRFRPCQSHPFLHSIKVCYFIALSTLEERRATLGSEQEAVSQNHIGFAHAY